MRAVNLIPAEQRSGGSRTGIGVYVFLGALGALAVALAALVLTGNQVKHRRAELAKAKVQTTAATAEAKALKPYADFAALRASRVETVSSLAKSRFDWDRVLSDLSRAMPRDAWVSTFTGTVRPGVSVQGGGGNSLRGALAVPAVELSGCATSQAEVARMMTRLHLVEGVTRVSLGSSEKPDSGGEAAASSDSAASTSGCGGSDKWPQFNVVIFFEDSTAAAPGSAGTAPTPAAQASATTAAAAQTSTTPAQPAPAASGTQTAPNATASEGSK